MLLVKLVGWCAASAVSFVMHARLGHSRSALGTVIRAAVTMLAKLCGANAN